MTPFTPRIAGWLRKPSTPSAPANEKRAITDALRHHDYGAVVDNQLRVLKHLGLLRANWKAEAAAMLRDELGEQDLSREEIDRRVRQATATQNQRSSPRSSLLFQSPEKYDRLANLYDEASPLEMRAGSYLHANCAHCRWR